MTRQARLRRFSDLCWHRSHLYAVVASRLLLADDLKGAMDYAARFERYRDRWAAAEHAYILESVDRFGVDA